MTSLQTASLDEIRKVAARLCRDYLTGPWKVVSEDELIVDRVSGGLSNYLYYVSLPEDKNVPGTTAASTRNSEHDDDNHNNINSSDSSVVMPPDDNDPADKNSNSAARAAGGTEGIVSDLVGTVGGANKRQRTESAESSASSATGKMRAAKEPREVLLRIYGQTHGEDALESMISESVVFALLSERNFGPKLHGIFPGGRIEQFIPARPLATLELADQGISMKIAERMGEIHSLNIPMSKEPDWVWNCMARWLKSTATILSQTDWKDEIKPHLQLVRTFDFQKEANWLKSVIDHGNYMVLFCHNDMQEGNILFREAKETQSPRDSVSSLRSDLEDSAIESLRNDEDNADGKRRKRSKHNNGNDDPVASNLADVDNTSDASALSSNSEDSTGPDLIIIDFEYCAYNYRGFDLANHFLEWTFDYTNPVFPNFYHHKHQYSTQQQREDFIVAYLKKLSGCDGHVPSAEEVHAVEQEVRLFSLLSHLLWSLWSVVNVTSNIEFGYWDYAVTRIREFKLLKQAFLNEKSDHTSAD